MGIKARLSAITFLGFAVWGSYLVSLSQYLGSAGLGSDIQWFYAVGGIIALFMPAVAGGIADRFVQAQKMLGLCHGGAAFFMFMAWLYGYTHPQPEFWALFGLFALSVAFFLPTIALCNSVCFASLKKNGFEPAKEFPKIRIWGTIGFVVMMWVVNSMWAADGKIGFTLSESSPHAMARFQYNVMQLLVAAIVGVIAAVYSFSLPRVEPKGKGGGVRGWRRIPIIGALGLFSIRELAGFFLFSMLIGVALQINNGYVTPFLTHFKGMPEYALTFGANNATLLSSLSQISEALWILPVGAILARVGIKKTLLMATVAWVVNFFCFATGNTGSGLWLIVVAMIVYGVAFNFYNIAGALYVDRVAPEEHKSAAQGLMMAMSKGVGASLGMICAGWIVNHFCQWSMTEGHRFLMGDWQTVWLIFAGYCALVALVFAACFSGGSQTRNSSTPNAER